MMRSGAAGLCLVALLGTGCVTAGPDPIPTATTPTATTAATTNAATSDAAPATASAEPGAPPAELVGAWSSSTDTTEIAYRFLADGRFRSIEILSQPRPGGIFSFSRQQDGRAEVDGDRLVLRPSSSTTTRTDPGDPQGDYTDRPGSPDERAYSWQVDGSVLALRDGQGIVLTFDRQS